ALHLAGRRVGGGGDGRADGVDDHAGALDLLVVAVIERQVGAQATVQPVRLQPDLEVGDRLRIECAGGVGVQPAGPRPARGPQVGVDVAGQLGAQAGAPGPIVVVRLADDLAGADRGARHVDAGVVAELAGAHV